MCPCVCGGQGNTPVRALSGISTLEFLGKKTLLFPLGLRLLEAESTKESWELEGQVPDVTWVPAQA